MQISDERTVDPLKIGEYKIIRRLGKGGMGVVYEAESPDGVRLALKLFTSSGAHAEFLRKRFIAEGRLLSGFSHPRLVSVREIGFNPDDGMPYFTMDMVLAADGAAGTLEDLRRGGGLDEERIAAFYDDLRSALVYLHERGVVHRDIKLENVLIDSDGRAVLSDFGVSRILRKELREEIAVTTTFASDRAPVVGSVGYLSPELKAGKAATPADDAWALGVLVFRLLTGVWYEENSSAMELLAGFDRGWTEILSTLLNREAKRRLPLPPSPSPSTVKRSRRYRVVRAVLGMAALLALAGFVYFSFFAPRYTFDEFFPPQTEGRGS